MGQRGTAARGKPYSVQQSDINGSFSQMNRLVVYHEAMLEGLYLLVRIIVSRVCGKHIQCPYNDHTQFETAILV